jgi:hypothetical protein
MTTPRERAEIRETLCRSIRRTFALSAVWDLARERFRLTDVVTGSVIETPDAKAAWEVARFLAGVRATVQADQARQRETDDAARRRRLDGQ